MFDTRLKDLKQRLLKEKLDGALISSAHNITYLTGYANFSKEERESYIFIGKDFAYIITDARYSEAIIRDVAHLKLFERGNDKSTEELFKKHKKDIKVLGVEEDNLTVSEHKILKKHFKKIKHFNLSRSIKEKWEIEKFEKACKLGDKTFEYVLGKVKSGISEKELAFELEYFIKRNGADLSFPTIVAFGKNSSIPHHHTGDTKLKKGDFVLLDFGVKLENYCSDMTRTVFFGKPSEKQKNIYKIVLEAQQKAVDFTNNKIKEGEEVKALEIDKMARSFIISKRYPSIPHSLGHGVGLQVHEHPSLSPKSKEILKAGMVFSIEPGIYIPGFGGVRIEDLFVLEKTELRQLTSSPKDLKVL